MKRILQIVRDSPLLLIAVVVLTANWQLLSGITGIKWDSSNYWHPWRYFISQCYNNGIVPLWNPYTQSGYPIHGDLQGPAYSIDAIATSFLFKGSMYSINLLYLAYLIFGAWGFYKLCGFVRDQTRLKNNEELPHNIWPAALAGIIYALSGYVTAHGHNLYIVVSVALLPWLYYYYFRMLKEGNVYNAIKFACIVFFQVTAGNPSFLIVSFYFFLLTALVRYIQWLRKKEYVAVRKSSVSFLWAGLFSLLLCAPVLLNAALIFADSTRGAGVTVEWAGLENSPWTGLFAFFTPLVGFENGVDGVTRQPIVSYYIGALSLLFACIGLLKFRSVYLRILGVFAIFSFLLSLGLDTPLFALLHKYLPFFNVFRMPKLIFIYDVFYLLILFSLGFHYVLATKAPERKQLLYYGLSAIAIIGISILYFSLYYAEGTEVSTVRGSSVQAWFHSSGQVYRALVSGSISILLIAVFFLVRKRSYWKYALAVLILAEVTLYYNITAIVRVFDDIPLAAKEKHIDAFPKKFPVPENVSPKDAAALAGRMGVFWMNASIYLEQPDYTGNNSFALSNHARLEDGHPTDFGYIINKPLATFIDSLKTEITAGDTGSATIAVCAAKDILATGRLKSDPADTIRCTSFLPGTFSYEVINRNKVGFLLQQTRNRFWKVRVNGVEQQPVTAFYSFPLLILQPGKNTIKFQYEVPYFHVLFVISISLFCTLLALLIFRFASWKYAGLVCLAGLIVYCLSCFYTGRVNAKDTPVYAKETAGVYAVNNTTRDRWPGAMRLHCNFLFPEAVAELMHKLPLIGKDTLVCSSVQAYFPPELERLIGAVYGGPVGVEENKLGTVRWFKKGVYTEKIVYEDKLQDTLLRAGIELKTGREFSKALKVKLSDFSAQAGDLIVLEAEVYSPEMDCPGLCFSLNNKEGQAKKFLSDHLVKKGPRYGRRCCVFYTLPPDFDPADEAGAFFWNNKVQSVRLYALSLKVIRRIK